MIFSSLFSCACQYFVGLASGTAIAILWRPADWSLISKNISDRKSLTFSFHGKSRNNWRVKHFHSHTFSVITILPLCMCVDRFLQKADIKSVLINDGFNWLGRAYMARLFQTWSHILPQYLPTARSKSVEYDPAPGLTALRSGLIIDLQCWKITLSYTPSGGQNNKWGVG